MSLTFFGRPVELDHVDRLDTGVAPALAEDQVLAVDGHVGWTVEVA